jgi:Outer membrane protein beta-barrel domain
MKRIVSVALAASVAIAFSAASAQAQVSIGVGGGLSLPLGDFSDAAKTGWNALANVGYDTPSGLGVRGDFYYGQHKFKGGLDAKWKLAGGLGNVLYSFQGKGPVTPYVMGTVGVVNLKADGGSAGSASESKLTFGGGGGIKFKAGTDSHVFAEARYLSINTSGSNANFIPITVGVSFGI